ncbi:hypothetical protein [Gimesia maris]|uniref:hypothetical protein n=1 Tax=Gimesia maris TaxID=122 RepID=UPI003A8F11CB
MLRLTPLVKSVLNFHRVVQFTMFGILLAFVIWFNYGTELDRAISGTPQTDSSAIVVHDNSRTAQELTADADEYRGESIGSESIGSESSQSSAPAILSIDEQMQKIDRDAMLANVEKLARDVTNLDSDLTAWNEQSSDLATNDSGRRMASNPEIFLAVAGLIASEPVSADDFAVLKSRTRLLGDEAMNVRQGNTRSSLDGAFASTKAMFEKLRTSLDHAVLSLAAFEKRSQLLKPSATTLADAMAAHKEKQAAEIASQLAKDKEETEQKIANEKREAQAMLNKLALEREREKAAAKTMQLQTEIENAKIAKQTAAAKQQLEAEFARDLPKIKHYLGKFFADGYTQPQSATHYEQRSTKGPVSLAAIQKAGALSDVVEGLDGAYPRFLHLMASPTNDRVAQSPYPRFIGGYVPRESAATVREGYTLLKKYQYLLVEKRYLAP